MELIDFTAAPDRKRSRTGPASRQARSSSAGKTKLAKFLAYQEAQQFPRATYGRAYFKRGSAGNLANFGETARLADQDQKENRQMHGYTGRGLYSGRGAYSVGKGLRALGGYAKSIRNIGRTMGTNAATSAAATKLIGSGLYSGRGAYTAAGASGGNALFAESMHKPAGMHSVVGEDGSVVITHREYLRDVYGPGTTGGPAVAFENNVIRLNPGLQESFPWLSQIAANYDEYEFIQLVYEYNSTTTDIGNSTNGQCGTIVMATNYNAANPLFTDKQQMVTYQNAESIKITESTAHGVECNPPQVAISPILYTRTNPVINGQDLKTYDKGTFQYALCNLPASYNGFPIGEMWVTYTVRLNKTKLYVTRGLEIDRDIFSTPTTTARGLLCNLANVTAFLTSQPNYFMQQNNIGCRIIAFSPFEYRITFPAFYVGNVSIKCIQTIQTPVAAAQGAPQQLVNSGNIVPINDMYTQNGDPTNTYVSAILPAGDRGDFGCEYHWFVSASTAGVDNTISLFFTATINNNPCKNYIEICQYNGEGMTKANDLLTWVNGALPSVPIAGNAI